MVLFSIVNWDKRSESQFSPEKVAKVIILIWMGSTDKKRFYNTLQNSFFTIANFQAISDINNYDSVHISNAQNTHNELF